jgi:HEPN domain-containing protein
MRDPRAEGRRWIEQARNDLDFARYAMQGGYHHQARFVSQQCAAKALKALHYADGARRVIGHSGVGLLGRALGRHPELASLNDLVAELDLFYVPIR